tara:strand:- start:133 stop:951 length:819 start_codon:yes stop_codon:yes gene_type:complete
MQLQDKHYTEFLEQGYTVVENFYPEKTRTRIATELRKKMPPWEEIKDDPPESGMLRDIFPYENQFFNELTVDPDLITFVQRILGTQHIHFRYAHNWTRYPNGPKEHRLHRDNGNNSLLPPCDNVYYGQISSWYFPEDVPEDHAPMMVIPKENGDDVAKAVSLEVQAGTQMIFNTFLWHSASEFKGNAGQRYSVTRIYGRADHYWEGVSHYTNKGSNKSFQQFIGSLTAKQRELFRFPPAKHPYYTRETLEALEKHYPGWNSNEEYVFEQEKH